MRKTEDTVRNHTRMDPQRRWLLKKMRERRRPLMCRQQEQMGTCPMLWIMTKQILSPLSPRLPKLLKVTLVDKKLKMNILLKMP